MKISFDFNGKKFDLGEVGSPDYWRKTFEMHREQLCSYRGKSPIPEELEWEIRLYEYILEDPTVRGPQYQNVRKADPGLLRAPLPKREVVAKLGWVIP